MINERRKRPYAAAESALAHDWGRDWLRDAAYAWRWPAGVLATLILWLALVALVGAEVLPTSNAEAQQARWANAVGPAGGHFLAPQAVAPRALRDRSGRL
jgi:hypothetical protein